MAVTLLLQAAAGRGATLMAVTLLWVLPVSAVSSRVVSSGVTCNPCLVNYFLSSNIILFFDQIPNLQNCFNTPNKNLGEGGAER
jgi:hypothetical protein